MRKILNSGQTREWFNTIPIIYLFTPFFCLPHIFLSSCRTFLSISSFASSLPPSPVGPSLLSPLSPAPPWQTSTFPQPHQYLTCQQCPPDSLEEEQERLKPPVVLLCTRGKLC